MNEVIIAKVDSIQRCVRRARQEYEAAGGGFSDNFSRQDAAVLNVTRACEQAIDLANHVLRRHRLGVPGSSVEGFQRLAREGVIDQALADKLSGMVGFRNIAVHQYASLELVIVEAVIRSGLDDIVEFTRHLVQWEGGQE